MAISSAATTGTTRLTYADLEAIPQERPGDRHELIDGVLYVSPSPVPYHQSVQVRFMAIALPVVDGGGLGRIYTAPVDIHFTPTDILNPDMMFIRADRLHIVGPSYVTAAPDLVVEILSPSTYRRDLGVKMALYERFGVPEYWVFDPQARTVALRVLEDGRYRLVEPENGRLRSTVIPGLVIDPTALFAAADLP